jgi:hypothetical protein
VNCNFVPPSGAAVGKTSGAIFSRDVSGRSGLEPETAPAQWAQDARSAGGRYLDIPRYGRRRRRAQGASAGVVAAEAAAPVPEGVGAIEMPPGQDPQARAHAASGLLVDLHPYSLEARRVIGGHGALLLMAEDLVEVDAPQWHEGRGGIGGRPAEAGVVGGQESLAEIAVGDGQRAPAGDPELIDEPILEGAVEAFAAPPGLGRVAGDVLDAELGQGAAPPG